MTPSAPDTITTRAPWPPAVPPKSVMELHEIATPLAYCCATLIAVGFWAAVHVQLFQKRQLTVQAILVLVAVLALAWGIVRFGLQ